ncbi:urease accessory protein UreD [Microbaculum marinum]|uniref:Urease accessory protein UreD n=1 Tax=Microbaculum marinum TaxID=1764581 RepID=A0AAW9RMU4_9HYPH
MNRVVDTQTLRPLSPPCALDLAVDVGADGRSRLLRRRVAFPWSMGRGFAPEWPGEPILILPQAAGAGLLSGDDVEQRLEIRSGAAARLESAGATMVHRGDRGAARSQWRFRLREEAALVVAAEPHVLASGCRLELRTDIEIEDGASFIGFEGICHAASLSGSEPAGAWFAETRVRRFDGRTLFVDRQEAKADDAGRVKALPGAPSAFGTVLVLGPAADRCGIAPGALELPGVYAAAAVLRAEAGLAVRIAAQTGGALRTAGRQLVSRAASALGPAWSRTAIR